MKMKKFGLIGVLSASLFMMAACSNETVAELDGGKVTKDELYNQLVSTYGDQAVNSLVVNKIAEFEAKKLKISVTDKDIDEKIDEIVEQYGNKETFEQALKASNTTMDDVKKEVKSGILLEKVLGDRVKNTDEELKKYFEEHKDSFKTEKEVKASHILVETEAKAKELLAKIKNGDDFAKLAKEYSKDEGSAIEGGDLGFFGKGKMVEAFDKVAFTLKKGEVSEPVKSEFGYHIIKVTDIKEAKEPKFEDVKENIVEAVTNQKLQQEYSSWSDEKFKEYKVDIKLNK